MCIVHACWQQHSWQSVPAGGLTASQRGALGLPWLWWAARLAMTQQRLLSGPAASLHELTLSALEQVVDLPMLADSVLQSVHY